ncbi:MAG TPA: hypothetical protein VGR12_02780 [Solirubrobacteraceae bacterium]|nr:hypothetical protein [Solirubrobacteraceae bacterium]
MRRVALTLSLALAFAACGDDRLSTEDYRAQLREICKQSEQRTNEVQEPTRATPEAIADYLQRLRDVNAQTIERVEELEPPEELQDAHDRALEANREGREKVDAVIRELEEGGDPTQVLTDARSELQDASRAAKQAGEDLGVPECAD